MNALCASEKTMTSNEHKVAMSLAFCCSRTAKNHRHTYCMHFFGSTACKPFSMYNLEWAFYFGNQSAPEDIHLLVVSSFT